MKITFEFDTGSENFEPQELWIMKHADNMWNALVEIRSELREKWKYSSEQTLDKDKLWERFHEIINHHNINGSDLI